MGSEKMSLFDGIGCTANSCVPVLSGAQLLAVFLIKFNFFQNPYQLYFYFLNNGNKKKINTLTTQTYK